MRPFLAMLIANLKMSVRNRTALFWNLAFPVIFILIFGAVFSNDDTIEFDVGLTGPPSPLHDQTLTAIDNVEVFNVHQGSLDELEDDLDDGDLDVIVSFGVPERGGQPIELIYDQTEGPNAQIALSAIRQVLLSVAGGEASATLAISERGVSALEVNYMDFLVPGILAMSLMNAGVIGMATSFVVYREQGILRRIKVTPLSLPSFIMARVTANVIVALIEAIILIVLARLIYGLHLRGNPLLLLLILIVGALTFMAVGFIVAGIARNVETAASYANLLTFPMLFLSGVFFDLSNAPAWLQPIKTIMPLHYLVDALRRPMMLGEGFSQIWLDLLILLAIMLVSLAIAIRFFRWDAREA